LRIILVREVPCVSGAAGNVRVMESALNKFYLFNLFLMVSSIVNSVLPFTLFIEVNLFQDKTELQKVYKFILLLKEYEKYD